MLSIITRLVKRSLCFHFLHHVAIKLVDGIFTGKIVQTVIGLIGIKTFSLLVPLEQVTCLHILIVDKLVVACKLNAVKKERQQCESDTVNVGS